MLRILLAVLVGVALSAGLDTGPSDMREPGEVQLALGMPHCRPSCGKGMTCRCGCRGDAGAPCDRPNFCYCVPK